MLEIIKCGLICTHHVKFSRKDSSTRINLNAQWEGLTKLNGRQHIRHGEEIFLYNRLLFWSSLWSAELSLWLSPKWEVLEREIAYYFNSLFIKTKKKFDVNLSTNCKCIWRYLPIKRFLFYYQHPSTYSWFGNCRK